ncbi:uncharacterized protein LOC135820670 [Sycon ciliatum]|uniref:uncharacterized protein LOC135820670 n=1 Tax=Sycon ciliatum TaxID=27933 RepID=UPI0031F6D184
MQVQGPAESDTGSDNTKNIDGHTDMVIESTTTPIAPTAMQAEGLTSQKSSSGITGYIAPNTTTKRDGLISTKSSSGNTGDYTTATANKMNNSADGEVFAPRASNPEDENQAWDDEIASRNHSYAVHGSLTLSESREATHRAGAQNNGDGNGNDGDDDDDKGSTLNLALIFLPLILAGCMLLAFAGFMVRRKRLQKQESGMTGFEPIKKTIQEPSSWDWVNKTEQPAQNQDKTQTNSTHTFQSEAAPPSDRPSVHKAHAKDIAYIDVGDFPVYLPDDASYIEQDIDALANELGEPQTKRMAMSPSTFVGSYSVQSFKADEMQFSNREDARSTPSNTAAGMHVSQSPTAANDAIHPLQLERYAAQSDGQEMRVQQDGTPEIYTMVSRTNRTSLHKAQSALFSKAYPAGTALHRADTHLGLVSRLGSKGLVESNSNVSIPSSHSTAQDPCASGLQGAATSTGIACGDNVQSAASVNAYSSTTLDQSQELAPVSLQTFTADTLSHTGSFYDDVIAGEGARTWSKKKKKGGEKETMAPSDNIQPSFFAEGDGHGAVEGQASMDMYRTVTRAG